MSSKIEDFEDILEKIARELYKRKDIEALGKALGFGKGDIGRCIDSNALQGGSSMGTLDMLLDWRKEQEPAEEWDNLKRALESAGFRRLAALYLTADKTVQHPGNVAVTATSSGASSQYSEGREENEKIKPDDVDYYNQKMEQAKPSKEQLDPDKSYKMDVLKKGRMFILNMTEGRPGSKVDVKNTEHVFKEIGYETEIYSDLTAKDLTDKLAEFVNSPRHKGMCSTVVMLMGHGTTTGIQCSGGGEVAMEHVKEIVSGMKSMVGKPKMIFFQCCRGKEHSEQVETDQIEPDLAVPAKSDVLIVHATTDGNVAYRNVENGTWFIQMLCEVLLESAHESDLSSMLEQVTGKVGKLSSKGKYRQCPVVVKQGISKKIYFLPKYPPQNDSA